MGNDRTWKLSRKHPFTTMFDGPKLELGETVSVVEESRLREAEAEAARLREGIESMRGPSTCGKHRQRPGDPVDPDCRRCFPPLVAQLQQTRDALEDFASPGSKADRARGVLEKDTGNYG